VIRRRQRKWKEVLTVLAPDDLTAISADTGKDDHLLYSYRAQAHAALKNGPAADIDLKRAIEKAGDGAGAAIYWSALGTNLRDNLKDPEGALEAYQRALDICLQAGNQKGFLPIQSSIDAAGIHRTEGRYEEALALLRRYENLDGFADFWKVKVLRALAEIYLGQGLEEQAANNFEKALTIETELKSKR
jgi:tetratricopeptide (TPR) repeat protein